MKKSVSIFLSLVIICISCVVFADTPSENNYNGYIVKYKQTGLRLFSADEKPLDNTKVVNDISKIDMSKVEYIVPNYKLQLFSDPYVNDTYASRWNYNAIKAKNSWDIGACGNNVKVGIIDTGLMTSHPDLNYNNVLPGRNIYYVPAIEDCNYDDNTQPGVSSDSFHGSFVAGIIGAVANNFIGIPGIADSAKIIPLKVDTYLISMLYAIQDAVDVFDCDVINISMGIGFETVGPDEQEIINVFQKETDYAIGKGAIIVAAVGNGYVLNANGAETANKYAYVYPASCNGVIGVGAIDSTITKAPYSQTNTSVFVTAPGSGITSIYGTGYATGDGTSFSSPHIAAMAAVAKNIKKDLTLQEFKQLLIDSSTDLGVAGYDTSYGWGLPDFEKMTNKLLENKSLFVSDIRTTSSNNGTLKIYNNSLNQFTASSILAKYNVNNLISTDIQNIDLVSKGKATISFSGTDKAKHLLFGDFTNIKPIYEVKQN